MSEEPTGHPPFATQPAPYVNFVQFCESVIHEPGRGPTLVRISNSISVERRDASSPPPRVLQRFVLAVSGLPPDATTGVQLWHLSPRGRWELFHEGVLVTDAENQDGNSILEMPVEFSVVEPGLHFLSVVIGARELTRVPMRLAAPIRPSEGEPTASAESLE